MFSFEWFALGVGVGWGDCPSKPSSFCVRSEAEEERTRADHRGLHCCVDTEVIVFLSALSSSPPFPRPTTEIHSFHNAEKHEFKYLQSSQMTPRFTAYSTVVLQNGSFFHLLFQHFDPNLVSRGTHVWFAELLQQ